MVYNLALLLTFLVSLPVMVIGLSEWHVVSHCLTAVHVHVLYVQHQHAAMVTFVWLEDTQTMRDVWKCASVDTGDMSVTMDGAAQGLWLCASSCLEKT